MYYFNILTRKNKHKYTIIENLKNTDRQTNTHFESSILILTTNRHSNQRKIHTLDTQSKSHTQIYRDRDTHTHSHTQKETNSESHTHTKVTHKQTHTYPHSETHITTQRLNLEEKS